MKSYGCSHSAQLLSHVQAIAAMDPQRVVVVDGLPLLLVYLGNMYP